jgi:hypothetical protein
MGEEQRLLGVRSIQKHKNQASPDMALNIKKELKKRGEGREGDKINRGVEKYQNRRLLR